MSSRLLNAIADARPGFSKGQKLIADYITEHYDKAAFMTAARLGATVGVSESTVVRFAAEIGFDGYPGLQKALYEMIRNRLTAVQRMEVTNDRMGDTGALQKVMQADMDAIKRTLEQADNQAFAATVEAIVAARKIYMTGTRSAASLAQFMSFYFTHIFGDALNVDTAGTGTIFERMLRIGLGDVFIGITFSRYSSRTYRAAAFARANGAKVIAITDSPAAPICKVADHVLIARSDMASFVDSLVAPLSLINALIVAIGMKKKDELAEIYARLETIWDECNVYQKADTGGAHDI